MIKIKNIIHFIFEYLHGVQDSFIHFFRFCVSIFV